MASWIGDGRFAFFSVPNILLKIAEEGKKVNGQDQNTIVMGNCSFGLKKDGQSWGQAVRIVTVRFRCFGKKQDFYQCINFYRIITMDYTFRKGMGGV